MRNTEKYLHQDEDVPICETLFRVVPGDQWQQATRSGVVPRCAADERDDCVHLNVREDVELAADLWFSPEERPVALEIDPSSVRSNLRWELRTKDPVEVWPNLYVPHLRADQVVAVHRLERDESGHFRFATRDPGPAGE
ncbi:MAG: DUF952 domain-containing protein [Pseudomonadota bacterium]|nr:DUF952 domain-containing protein [Pseudomonadota bacterium]